MQAWFPIHTSAAGAVDRDPALPIAHVELPQVAQRGAMDKVAVSRAVAKLLESGRLEREFDDDDRRRSVLRLSEAGYAVYDEVAPLALAFERHVLDGMPAEERELLFRLLDRLELSVTDIDLIELNEAFAAQVVPVVRELGVDPDRVNVNGGAIALGHPFGATGVRLVGTLVNALAQRDLRLGLATLCVGGGQGMALVVERLA